MLRAVVLTQYRRVTDGRTDGIAVANTAPAMRALRNASIARAVKIRSGVDISYDIDHQRGGGNLSDEG